MNKIYDINQHYEKALLALLLLSTSLVCSQNKSFKIQGKLIAADTKQPLESATIYLEKVKDSSLVTYTISDKNGQFSLEDKTYESNLNLFISYVGMPHIQKPNPR